MFAWFESLDSLDKASDEELLAKIGAPSRQSNKAFEILFNRYEKAILNYCFRILRNRDEAHDAKQETFLRMWRNSQYFEQRSSMKAWLYTIAHNTCISFIRKRKPTTLFQEEETMNVPNVNPGADRDHTARMSPERMVFNNEVKKKVIEIARRQLSQQEQFILFSTYFATQSLSLEEIANELRISKNLASQKRIRAQNKLKTEIFLSLKEMILFDEAGVFISFEK